MKRHFREAMEGLREQGATDVRLVHCRRHHRIAYTYRGQQYERPVSGTPSDTNWFKQFKRDLSRLVQQKVQQHNVHR